MKERKFLTPKSELTEEQLAVRNKRKNEFIIISAILFLVAMAGITYLLFPFFRDIGEEGWLERVRERIDSHGRISGIFVFVAIQAIQVIVAVIPPVQTLAGVLYGWFFGAMLSFTGIVLGALAVWGIVKKLGAPLVEAVIGEKHIKKFAFLEDDRKLLFILILLYTIPGIPKDVITYIVPLTKIKMRDFFFYVIPFRIPAVLMSTIFASNMTSGNYVAAIVVVSIIVVIAIFGVMFRDKLFDHLNKRRSEIKAHKLSK